MIPSETSPSDTKILMGNVFKQLFTVLTDQTLEEGTSDLHLEYLDRGRVGAARPREENADLPELV